MTARVSGLVLNREKTAWRDYCSSDKHSRGDEIRIGLASSFTVEPLEPYLGVSLIESGFRPSISIAPYNQIHQVCLDPSSAFGGALPDCICIMWRIEEVLAQELNAWCQGDASAIQQAVDRLSELAALIKGLEANHAASIVVSTPTFPVRPETSITDLGNIHEVGLFYSRVSREWYDLLAQLESVLTIDLDGLQRQIGVAESVDIRKWYLYKQPFTESFLHAAARQLSRIINTIHRPSKKCVAVDCDNTLWGGIIGEDGLSGIELGHDFPGSAFRDFQKLLLHWKNQGAFIAILSKNNEEDVWEVFERHEGMVLKQSDIAAWRINWDPKTKNLSELATELNIGIDSFVFVDDNSFEIEQMKEAYPDIVECFQIPEEAAFIVSELRKTYWFDKIKVSAEDRVRTDMMISERQRRPLQQSMTHEEFVASLNLKTDLFAAKPEHIGRVTQLINKTNQFNLTTIRRTEEEVIALYQSSDHVVYAARIQDRFGDYGITGVVIINEAQDHWYIDTFLLSCRVLGRGVESAIIGALAECAKSKGVSMIKAKYLRTKKNKPIESFLPAHGFKESNGEFILSDFPSVPEYVTIEVS